MVKRFLMVGSATGVAALVLLLSLWAGSPRISPTTPVEPRRDPHQPADVAPYQPGQVITDPAHFGRDQLTRGAQGGTYVFEDDDRGRRTVLTYHVITPQPQGVYDVEKPTAQTILSDRRRLVIQADRGHFVAPENKLRQGSFEGHVVLSLYETDGRQADDPTTDADVVLRIFLDEVRFDVDLAHLESAGDLHVTGPRIDFRGQGLSLVYNDQHNRIQKLEVRRAKSLRFKPDASEASAQSSSRPVLANGPGEGLPPSTSSATQPQRSPVQFYRARFEEQVTVTGSANRVKMAGDYLTAFFSLEQHDAGRGENQGATQPQPDPVATTPRQAEAADVDQAGRSLCPVSADDVILRWAGRLLVEPAMDLPTDLAEAGDLLVQFVGTPFTLATAKGETVTGRTAGFLASRDRIRAVGDRAFPLRVASPGLGQFTGSQVVLYQQQGTGFILGPGTLEADRSDHQHLQARWDDRLDLAFFPSGQGSDPLEALASATFQGPVTVSDPRFTLDAHDTLALKLTDPDQGDQTLKHIHAVGDVHLQASDAQKNQHLTLEAQSLTIVPTSDPDADQPFETLTARGETRIAVDDPAIVLQGDHLAIDTASDELELLGSPASASAKGSTLQGPRMVMRQADQRLTVHGAGSFDTPIKPGQPQPRLAVQWSDQMDFDNRTGQAHFQGRVLAQSREGHDVTRLSTEQLALQVTPEHALSHTQDRALETLTASQDVVFMRETYPLVDPREVKLGLAPAVPDKPATRLTLKGPSLTFTHQPDQQTQRIDVPGPGTMLLEDYRATSATDTASLTPSFTGRGATLFLWDGRQILDVHAYDMTLLGDVQMLHRPLAPQASIVQLDCQRLRVDLAQDSSQGESDDPVGDGLASAPLRVQQIDADQQVRIVASDKTITADWLRYTARDQVIKLLANPRSLVQVAAEDQPTALRAAELWWDLARNRFEVRKPVGSVVPIPQSLGESPEDEE